MCGLQRSFLPFDLSRIEEYMPHTWAVGRAAAVIAVASAIAGCGDDDANGSEDAAPAAETAMKEK